MSEVYILIDGEPEIEECPECGFDALYVLKLTAMNDDGIGGMESTIRKCVKCAKGEDT